LKNDPRESMNQEEREQNPRMQADMITRIQVSKPGAVHHRLGECLSGSRSIGPGCHPDSSDTRDRHLFLDQLQHADIAKIALAEIEPREIHTSARSVSAPLVEAELLFQPLCDSGLQPLRAGDTLELTDVLAAPT